MVVDGAPVAAAPPHGAAPVEAWARLIDALPDAAWLVDGARLRVLAANAASDLLFGRAMAGCDVRQACVAPEDLCFWDDAAAGLADGIVSDTLAQRADGRLVPVTRSVRRLGSVCADADPEPVFLAAFHDLTGQRRAERDAEVLVAELRATLESTADALLVTDLAGRVRCHNARFAALWELPLDLLTRRDDDGALDDWMRRAVADPGPYAERLAAIRRDALLQASDMLQLRSGRIVERVTLPQLSRGLAIGRVWSFRDVTDRLEATRRIEQLSRTDALTGLPNRRCFGERVEAALAAARQGDAPFALMFLDLDRFKHVNDSLGHQVGDRVLVEASRRIARCLRQADTVARLGGDEFVMLVQPADAGAAEAAARRVLEALAEPFVQGSLSFTVTCSVGIALHPADGLDADELMRHADKAMYGVKDGGRAGFRFHQPHDPVDPLPRMRIDHAMRQALVHGRFRVAFQPQQAIASGRVVGAEALLRWRDPELGDVPPGDFIPLAEESGFIVPLGEWVLAQAVRQAAAWHAEGRGVCVAVNVSALQFAKPGFVDGVARALEAAELPPELLELELTESILLTDAEEALARLHRLAALGVRLSIDDFGTGYSSLSYLKRFPIRRLKIDRSFVAGLLGEGSDAAIVRAVVEMARALGLEVIAEGVETEAQRALLERLGCALYQGFHAAPALDAHGFAALLPPLAPAAQPPHNRPSDQKNDDTRGKASR